MTSIDDRKVVTKLPPQETRAAGRFNAAGVPTESEKDFSGLSAGWAGYWRPSTSDSASSSSYRS